MTLWTSIPDTLSFFQWCDVTPTRYYLSPWVSVVVWATWDSVRNPRFVLRQLGSMPSPSPVLRERMNHWPGINWIWWWWGRQTQGKPLAWLSSIGSAGSPWWLWHCIKTWKTARELKQMSRCFGCGCQRSRCLTNSPRVNCVCRCSQADLVHRDHRLWPRVSGG